MSFGFRVEYLNCGASFVGHDSTDDLPVDRQHSIGFEVPLDAATGRDVCQQLKGADAQPPRSDPDQTSCLRRCACGKRHTVW